METKKKYSVLVLGSDGMAGSMIAKYLDTMGHRVHATQRNGKGDGVYQFDVVSNISDIDNIIMDARPDFVVNCIGVLNQFADDNKSDAVLINAYLPHYLSARTRRYGFRLVHMSTDCVFSGEKGSYCESDVPDAQSFYGKTKILGEVLDDKNTLTFRTSIIGPDINANGIGLFHWFMSQNGKIGGFSNVLWSGVTTLEFAKSVEKSFDMPSISGLFHLVNNESISKYNLLLLFKKYSKKNIDISIDDTYTSDKTLVNTNKQFDFNLPSYDDMVREMIEWIELHEDMYNYSND